MWLTKSRTSTRLLELCSRISCLSRILDSYYRRESQLLKTTIEYQRQICSECLQQERWICKPSSKETFQYVFIVPSLWWGGYLWNTCNWDKKTLYWFTSRRSQNPLFTTDKRQEEISTLKRLIKCLWLLLNTLLIICDLWNYIIHVHISFYSAL